MKIHFLGAVGTVTGSKYLLEGKDKNLLIDCGLYQGYKQLRQRNWRPIPYDASKIDAVLLSHAHLDHSGYLPALVARGYSRPIFATKATRELCEILLMDSAHLQEEEAKYANRRGSSRHNPALPLYNKKDVEATLALIKDVEFGDIFSIGNQKIQFIPSGHILGASSVRIESAGQSVVFSGDIGRNDDAVMYPPKPIPEADVVIMESTYGDRCHDNIDVKALLADIITQTAARAGSVLIPSFAVGRAQTLMHLITQLKVEEKIPNIPVYLNSPMAISVAELYRRHHSLHRLSASECNNMCEQVHYVRTAEESISLLDQETPSIIISASGMATGGRVLHHLQHMLPDPKHSVLFAGYQAPGTRGWRLCQGENSIKIFGKYYDVNAQVNTIDVLSAHADAQELLSWLSAMNHEPRRIFLTHGENNAVDALRLRIKEQLNWHCEVPDYQEIITL